MVSLARESNAIENEFKVAKFPSGEVNLRCHVQSVIGLGNILTQVEEIESIRFLLSTSALHLSRYMAQNLGVAVIELPVIV